MELLTRLAEKIGNDLVHSSVIKEEDAEIYIYGINQILVSVLNVSSALIIGLVFGVFFEITVFMAAYIPLRSFAGGYHAKTPLRCYIFSVIMVTVVSIGMKYLYIADWVYYAVLSASALVVIILAPVEDSNKPLDETEHKVYKKRTMLIAATELIVALLLKLLISGSLSVAIVYSFVVLSLMLIAGKVKNRFDVSK